jgi:hypothetical protein
MKDASKLSPVCLHVVTYRGGVMLYDRISKRATTCLRARDLPGGTKLILVRGIAEIATAVVTFEGYSGHGGNLFEVFCGESCQLVLPEAALMRSRHLPEPGRNYAGEIRAENLMKNDMLVMTLTDPQLVPDAKKRWPLERWLRDATFRSKRDAYEAGASEAAWLFIGRLFKDVPGDSFDAFQDFFQANRRMPWREALFRAIGEIYLEKRIAFPKSAARTK